MRDFLVFLAGVTLSTSIILGAEEGSRLFDYDFGKAIQTAPTIDLDGTVYIGGKGSVAAITPIGNEIWKTNLSNASQPDIGAISLSAEHLYATSATGIFALLKNGQSLWNSPSNTLSSLAAIAANGDIYVGDSAGALTAFRNGEVRWSKTIVPKVGPILPLREPMILADQSILVNIGPGELVKLDPNGNVDWSRQLGPGPNVSPVSGEEGIIYVLNSSANLRTFLTAYRTDGEKLWDSAGFSGSFAMPPVLASSGTIYFATIPNSFGDLAGIVALNPDRSTKWTYDLFSSVAPAITTEGNLLVAGVPFTRSQFGIQMSNDRVIRSLRPDGSLIWSYTNGVAVVQAITVGLNGNIYLSQENGKLLALRGSSELASGSWPSYARDSRHTAAQRPALFLQTGNPDLVTETGARLHGSIITPGFPTTVFFEYAAGEISLNSNSQEIAAGTTSQSFHQVIEGLTAGTLYTVRAVASNSVGVVKGPSISFRTIGTSGAVPPTLQALEAAAEAGGTVTFSGPGTITINNPLDFTRSTVIDANGHNVVLSGSQSTLIKLGIGVDLTLRGLTLTGGVAQANASSAGNGGAIINNGGNLIIEKSTLKNNHARGHDGSNNSSGNAAGGAIWQNGGSLMVLQSTFADNGAHAGNNLTGANIGVAKGGAIFANGANVTIVDSTLTNNAVVGGTAFPHLLGEVGGGAVYMEDGSLSITNSFFGNNLAVGSSGLAETAGGALWVNAGANGAISECQFSGNSVQGGVYSSRIQTEGAPAFGGAIMNAGTLHIQRSSFILNKTVGGQGRYANAGPSSGGAVYNRGILSVVNTTLASNSATSSVSFDGFISIVPGISSAIFSQTASGITNSAFVSNSGSRFAIAADAPGITLKNSLLAHNSAQNAGNNVLDAGNNISTDESPQISTATSKTNIDPLLGPLGYYGGTTKVFPLKPGSPAIHTADDAVAPAVDQRGRNRPYGGHADIGPFESSAPYYVWGTIHGYHAPNTVIASNGTFFPVKEDGSFLVGPLPAGAQQFALSGTEALFKPNPLEINLTADTEWNTLKSYKQPSLVFDGTADAPAFTLATFPGEQWKVESSDDLAAWNPMGTFTVNSTGLLTIELPFNKKQGFLHITRLP